MGMLLESWAGLRRRRGPVIASLIALVLLLTWTAAGFLLLPWYAKRELPRLAAEQGLRLQIEALAFNPYTLRLSAAGVALQDGAGGGMAGFSAASVDLEWRSVWRRAWIVSEVLLEAPELRAVIDPAGRLNLAVLLGSADDKPATALPRFEVGRVALSSGVIVFEDDRAGYRTRLEKLNFELSSLTTLATDGSSAGRYALRARDGEGGSLNWDGAVSPQPLSLSGVLAIRALSLRELTPYLDDVVALRIGTGSADLKLPFRLALVAGAPNFSVEGGALAVTDLELFAAPAASSASNASLAPATTATDPAARPRSASDPLLRLPSLQLEGLDFDLASRRAAVQNLAGRRSESFPAARCSRRHRSAQACSQARRHDWRERRQRDGHDKRSAVAGQAHGNRDRWRVRTLLRCHVQNARHHRARRPVGETGAGSGGRGKGCALASRCANAFVRELESRSCEARDFVQCVERVRCVQSPGSSGTHCTH